MTEKNDNVPDWILPNKVYDVLKWVGLIVLPATATATLVIGNAVGWADAGTAATIITAIGTLVGTCIGVTTAKSGGDNDEND